MARNNKQYRKIYIDHYGPIPTDDTGRTYDIHHIDGNYLNNDPSNLVALSLQEHYKVHKQQEDWRSCQAILMRSKAGLTREEISKIAKESNQQRVNAGTHNFLDGEKNKQIQLNRFTKGTHPFLEINKKRAKDGNQYYKDLAQKRVKEGTHPLSSELAKRLISEGKHAGTKVFSTTHKCPHCGATGKGAVMYRWHNDNCKEKNHK